MRNFDRDNRNDTRGPRFEKKGFGGPKKFGGDRERSFDKPRFGGARGGDRGGYGASRSFDKPMMHDATCSACGNDCKVPFMPNGRKPIFCSACFEKQGNGGGSERSFDRPRFGDREERSFGGKDKGNDALVANLKAQLDEVNSKLDKILRTLSRTNKTDDRALDFGESILTDTEVEADSSEEAETTVAAPKKKGYPKKAGEKKNKLKK